MCSTATHRQGRATQLLALVLLTALSIAATTVITGCRPGTGSVEGHAYLVMASSETRLAAGAEVYLLPAAARFGNRRPLPARRAAPRLPQQGGQPVAEPPACARAQPPLRQRGGRVVHG